MARQSRENTIHMWLERIRRSPLSPAEYLSKHHVPFGLSQYYHYRKKLKEEGIESLRDGRSQGNHRRVPAEAEGFLKGYVTAHAEASLGELWILLKERFTIELTESGISRCLKRLGCELRPRGREEKVERTYTVCGGFELIAALAHNFGWPEAIAEVISDRVSRLKSDSRANNQFPDRGGRDRQGQFTASYNRRRDVRESRFQSLESKREHKDFAGMSISSASSQVLARKCLAGLALPVLTNNGALRTVDAPLGNALLNLCGVNYKQATLNKFLAELKYLGVAEDLLRQQVVFWQEFWKSHPRGPLELPVLCYYVDGNTKALWSKKRVRQNKVTMLGRVMGCLEQVFVHDNFGRPIYFETYSGHAPVGEYVLSIFEKIEESLQGPGPSLPVNRAIVIDGAGNSVRTLRAFAAQDKYHYITSLDDNQWNPRKLRREGRPQRYRHGKATLRDCEMELEDSRDKGYLIISRAVEIEWDYGKRTVLLTSLSPEVVTASDVVKGYFDRWPDQELPFRAMKAVACLHRVVGYGKQKLTDTRVLKRQKELRELILGLKTQLAAPLREIAKEDKVIASLVKQERPVRARSRIVDGRRILPEQDEERFLEMGRKIRSRQRHIKSIEKTHAKLFRSLRKAEREWLRLQGKETVYKVDVELDQIMTSFRVSLVNLYSHLAHELFGNKSISMNRLVQTVMLLPALIEETPDRKEVTLQYNEKDRETMESLRSGLARINDLGCRTLKGKPIEFKLGKIDSGLTSST